MATHDFEPTHFHVTIGSHEPVLRVASGDTVRTWCVDSGGWPFTLPRPFVAARLPAAS